MGHAIAYPKDPKGVGSAGGKGSPVYIIGGWRIFEQLNRVCLYSSQMRYSHVFIDIFTKISPSLMAGAVFGTPLDRGFLTCLATLSCLGRVFARVLDGFHL